MRGPTTTRTTTRTSTAVAAVATAAAAVLAMAGCSGPDATPTPGGPSTPAVAARADVSEHLTVLQRPFAETDALPDGSTADGDTVVPDSQRRVGTVDGTTYWVAAGTEGGACLIAVDTPDSPSNWTTCGGNAADGSFVGASTVVVSMVDEQGHRTSLVTDGFTDGGSDAMHEIAPNVWAS